MKGAERVFSSLVLCLLFLQPASAADSAGDLRQDTAHLLRGLDYFYDLDFARSREEFERVISLDSKAPAGYFYKAMVLSEEAVRTKKNENDAKRARDELVDTALKVGEERLKDGTPPPFLYLVLAMAEAVMAQAHLSEGRYLTAWEEAKQGHAYLHAAARMNPDDPDVQYGLGVLDYYLSRAPKLSRVLLSVLLVSGDRQRGLEELEQAARRGVLSRMAARIELAHIYANMEKDYEHALPYAQELVERYPDNPDFYFLLANVLSELTRGTEADGVAERLREKLERGDGWFEPVLWPRYHHLLGKLALDREEMTVAEEEFHKALEVGDPDYLWVKAWALVRLGMIQDLRGARKEAQARYREALALQEEGPAAETARRYLKKPYRGPHHSPRE